MKKLIKRIKLFRDGTVCMVELNRRIKTRKDEIEFKKLFELR